MFVGRPASAVKASWTRPTTVDAQVKVEAKIEQVCSATAGSLSQKRLITHICRDVSVVDTRHAEDNPRHDTRRIDTRQNECTLSVCPVDGLFVTRGVASAAGGAKLHILDCATPCPTCGRAAELLPGLYESDGDHLNFLLDPSVSDEALAALRKLLFAVRAGEMTPEAAQKEAEKVRPGWGRFFDFSKWSPEVKAAMIIAAATLIAARIGSSPSVTVNNYIQTRPAITEPVSPRKHDLLGSTAMTHPVIGNGVHHPPHHPRHPPIRR